jgi:anaerobic C4-dicarboxylate transporter
MMWIELALLLACILVGARSAASRSASRRVGLAGFVFLFAMPPGQPPSTVLGMILAVITALAVMEAAGGLALVVALAERVLRGNPRAITLLGPLVMYLLIFMAGTQHVAYALLPVIAEVSEKAGVRPERPLSMSVIAAQHGLIASPISAATVALLAGLAGAAVPLPKILMVIVPATLIGCSPASPASPGAARARRRPSTAGGWNAGGTPKAKAATARRPRSVRTRPIGCCLPSSPPSSPSCCSASSPRSDPSTSTPRRTAP